MVWKELEKLCGMGLLDGLEIERGDNVIGGCIIQQAEDVKDVHLRLAYIGNWDVQVGVEINWLSKVSLNFVASFFYFCTFCDDWDS